MVLSGMEMGWLGRIVCVWGDQEVGRDWGGRGRGRRRGAGPKQEEGDVRGELGYA